jgi:flavin-dependent dehydrogenase
VLAKQLDIRGVLEDVFEGQWANFAIRLHFFNVNMKYFTEGVPNYDPATVNILPEKDCWYWFIPLDLEKGMVSIGFVARYKLKKYIDDSIDKKQAYVDLIARHPVLAKVIEGAEVSDNIVATSRLGHMNTKMCGSGYICVGDAAFFADPAWGTGVTIALRSAEIAADIVTRAHQKSDYSDAMVEEYEKRFREVIQSPFNSIRAYNYYYNDTEYVDFIVDRLNKNSSDMDMIGAVLFDYASHEEFQKWTFREFKAFVRERGRLPVLSKVSQFNFDDGTIAGQKISGLKSPVHG